MLLSKNVLIGIVGQGYVAAIGIFMVPVYIDLMGPEAYGLIGFFTVIQTWVQLADLGFTPTMSREFSRFRAGAIDGAEVATRLRTMEWLSGSIGMVLALGVVASAPHIANNWLNPGHLAPGEVVLCVAWMGVMIGLRSLSGLYRGGLAGLELIVSLNWANMALATVRSIGVVLILLLWTTRPSGFFLYQVAIGVLELLVLGVLFYRAFPMRGTAVGPVFESLRGLFRMAGGMAFLSGLWVVISQTDKLVLSWMLELRNFGIYMVVATLAGSINLIVAPVQQALQSRLVVLAAAREHESLHDVFRTCTQAMSAVLFAVAGVMSCFAEPLLLAWTGDAEAAREGARILPQYAMGSACAGLLGLAFVVQFAYGSLRAHIVGNILFSLIWVPGVILAAGSGGAAAAGWVWFAGNLLFLALWVPGVLQRLVPGLGWNWLLCDVAVIALATAGATSVAWLFGLPQGGRWAVLVAIAAAATLATLAGIMAGNRARMAFGRWCATVFRLQRT